VRFAAVRFLEDTTSFSRMYHGTVVHPFLFARRQNAAYGLSEKSKFSAFSTRRGVCCVKNARNPQRIPALFALQPLTPYEKSVHFFVFRNALITDAVPPNSKRL